MYRSSVDLGDLGWLKERFYTNRSDNIKCAKCGKHYGEHYGLYCTHYARAAKLSDQVFHFEDNEGPRPLQYKDMIKKKYSVKKSSGLTISGLRGQ